MCRKYGYNYLFFWELWLFSLFVLQTGYTWLFIICSFVKHIESIGYVSSLTHLIVSLYGTSFHKSSIIWEYEKEVIQKKMYTGKTLNFIQ